MGTSKAWARACQVVTLPMVRPCSRSMRVRLARPLRAASSSKVQPRVVPQPRQRHAQRSEVGVGRQDRHPTIRRCRPLPCQCRSLHYLQVDDRRLGTAGGQGSALRCGRLPLSLTGRARHPGSTDSDGRDNGPMRLASTHATVQRIWTVELRPQPGGPALACPRCTLHGHPVQAASARSAALTHLARHARTDALPGHLRTCQCRARGCHWHPRHRGCAGPVLLALTRDRSGRTWRLADACAACAAATSHTAVVPAHPPRPTPSRTRPAPARAAGWASRTHPRAGDAHLSGSRAPPVHLPRRPPARPPMRPTLRHPRPCPTARWSAARHATARPQRTVGRAGTHTLATPHSRQAPAYTGTVAGRGSPLPATGQPSTGPRRALGPAPHSPDAADRTTCGSAADRTDPGLAHRRRRWQYRHGGARPPVRTLTSPDRRTPRPTDDITHPDPLAPRPRNRRSLLAPAPTARHRTARRASNALTTVHGRQMRLSAGHRPGGTTGSARPYYRYTGADCTRCGRP